MQNKLLNFDAIINWIRSNFDINLLKLTLSSDLEVLELSVQLVGKRGTKSSRCDQYAQGYYPFLQELQEL